MMQEQLFQTPQFSLNYAEGPKNGSPLLLLPGSSSRWQAFLSILPELTSQWHVYALDYRGHGRSDRTPGGYHFDNYASDVALFIEKCIGTAPIIFGHSLGAMIGMKVAAQHPEKVKALIIGDPPFSFEALSAFAGQQRDIILQVTDVLSKAEGRESIKNILKKLPILDPKTGNIISTAEHFGENHPWFDFHAESLELADIGIFQSLLVENLGDAFSSYHPEKFLPLITCPTLLLRGGVELGGLIPEAEAKRMLRLLPNGKDALINHVGHGLYVDDKTPVLQAIMAFLDTVNSEFI